MAEHLFTREFTDVEIEDLTKRAEEEPGDWQGRLYEICEEHRDLLDLAGFYGDVDIPTTQTSLPCHSLDHSAACGDFNDDQDVWCAATRLDLEQLRPVASDWQTYMVSKSKSMRFANMDLVYTPQEVGESWDYMLRITDDDNCQEATIDRISSIKPLKGMVHAINCLAYLPRRHIHSTDVLFSRTITFVLRPTRSQM